MEQEIYMLPVRCASCRRIFDLWHVLQEQESGKKEDFGIGRILKQSLCPVCRNSVLVEEELEADTELAEIENGVQEYEIVLDFNNE